MQLQSCVIQMYNENMRENYSPESGEQNETREKREAIIEKWSGLRHREILKKMFASRAADAIGALTPGIDVIKFTGEAMFGVSTAKKELSSKERFSRALIAGGIATSYIFAALGMPNESLEARLSTAAYAAHEFGPEIIKEAWEKIKDKSPKTAHILESIMGFAKNNAKEAYGG